MFADAHALESSLLRAHGQLDDALKTLGLANGLPRQRIRQMIGEAQQSVRGQHWPRAFSNLQSATR